MMKKEPEEENLTSADVALQSDSDGDPEERVIEIHKSGVMSEDGQVAPPGQHDGISKPQSMPGVVAELNSLVSTFWSRVSTISPRLSLFFTSAV
jgi:hypothetical protein